MVIEMATEYKIEYSEEFYDSNYSNVIKFLNVFYQRTLGISEEGLRRAFGLYIKDNSNNLIGGLVGYSELRWFYVDSLYIAEEHRHKGLATKLMHNAEGLAYSRNCCGIKLETYQNLVGFFKKFGYFTYYIEKSNDDEIDIYYLKKDLSGKQKK